MYNVTLSCARVAIVAVGKTNITHSEFASVVLVIQHAKRMRRIILPSVTCLGLPHISTLSHNGTILRKRKLSSIKYMV